MIMKKIQIVYFLSLFALIFTSCKQDFHEKKKSFDKYDESVFSNEVETGWYIDNVYYNYFSAYKSPIVSVVGLYNDTRTRMTEEIGGTVPDMINSQKTLVDANQADGYYGIPLSSGVKNNPYDRIRSCNFLLLKINERGQALSSDFKNKARDQMYFLMALQYFDLMRVYGGVPIDTSVQEASPYDESIKLPRATTTEVVAQIIKDFDSASVLLPADWDG